MDLFVQKHFEAGEMFPKYPRDSSGLYMKAFLPTEKEQIKSTLRKYGVVVVRMFDAKRCDQTVEAMFAEMNENQRDTATKPLKKDDPSTWETENWPTARKFLAGGVAQSEMAFRNRLDPTLVGVFAELYGTSKLWASIDHWGVMRGTVGVQYPVDDANDAKGVGGGNVTRNREDWRVPALKLHWDQDLPRYFSEIDKGAKRRYQGILAVDNCPESVGGFCAVPGSHEAAREWLRRGNRPYNYKFVPEGDAMHNHVQRFPLRKGDMVIWDFALAHANFENRGKALRLVQMIRMMPEGTLGTHDNRSPVVILKKNAALLRKVKAMRLSRKQLRLLGLERY